VGLLKGACAQVNKDLGLLATRPDAIIAAAAEIRRPADDSLPIDVFPTAVRAPASNMNTNEVIASHRGHGDPSCCCAPTTTSTCRQSSNDTFPTATHIAATEAAVRHLNPGARELHNALAARLLSGGR